MSTVFVGENLAPGAPESEMSLIKSDKVSIKLVFGPAQSNLAVPNNLLPLLTLL